MKQLSWAVRGEGLGPRLSEAHRHRPCTRCCLVSSCPRRRGGPCPLGTCWVHRRRRRGPGRDVRFGPVTCQVPQGVLRGSPVGSNGEADGRPGPLLPTRAAPLSVLFTEAQVKTSIPEGSCGSIDGKSRLRKAWVTSGPSPAARASLSAFWGPTPLPGCWSCR